jgi:hypothetical protein
MGGEKVSGIDTLILIGCAIFSRLGFSQSHDRAIKIHQKGQIFKRKSSAFLDKEDHIVSNIVRAIISNIIPV